MFSFASISQAEMKPKTYSFSPMIGLYEFEGDQDLDTSPVLSLRLAYQFTSRWALEGAFEFIPSESNAGLTSGQDVDGFLYHLDGLYHFRTAKKFVPYLVAGLGAITLDDNPQGDDTNLIGNYGLGAKYFFDDQFALRADVRHIFYDDDQTENNLEVALGLVFTWGGDQKQAPLKTGMAAPADADGDGIADSQDRCANTPSGAKVDSKGCPLDSDQDGIADHMDQCPNTPAGKAVDGKGCSVKTKDRDGDGVLDKDDRCPNTRLGIKVGKEGCPADQDQDGIADHLDQCPDTPKALITDNKGCTLDSDEDGISDSRDRCANTPVGLKVNEKGCPIVQKDSDGDGVFDTQDKCPNTLSGAPVDSAGCMAVKDKASVELSIGFDSGKSDIKPQYEAEIRKVADFMKAFPNTSTEIEGHTDNTGSDRTNRVLSQKRADSVRQYLITRFKIDPSRLTAKGYGASAPTADNTSPEGRVKNRRVVATITADKK